MTRSHSPSFSPDASGPSHNQAPPSASGRKSGDTTAFRPGSPALNRLKMFVRYLSEHSQIGRENLPGIMSFYNHLDRRIGHLCALKGYLSLADVHYVMSQQSLRDELFGRIAVQLGLVDKDKMASTIALQKNPFDLFVESLRILRVLDDDRLSNTVVEFERSSRTPGGPAGPAPPLEPAMEIKSVEPGPRLKREDLRETLRKISSLGTLPSSVQRVLTLSANPDTKISELAETIKADPMLSTEVLRLVNSASGGAVRKFKDIGESVGRLGLAGVRNVALAVVVLNGLKGGDKATAKEIWTHSVATAVWAEELASVRPGVRSEDAFLAGLLHDIGRAMVMTNLPKVFAEIRRLTAEGRSLKEAELEASCQTHADVGAYLCSLWQFPPEVVQAVAYHHTSIRILNLDRGRLLPLSTVVNGACGLGSVSFDEEDLSANQERILSMDAEFRKFHRIDEQLAERVPRVLAKIERYSHWLS